MKRARPFLLGVLIGLSVAFALTTGGEDDAKPSAVWSQDGLASDLIRLSGAPMKNDQCALASAAGADDLTVAHFLTDYFHAAERGARTRLACGGLAPDICDLSFVLDHGEHSSTTQLRFRRAPDTGRIAGDGFECHGF